MTAPDPPSLDRWTPTARDDLVFRRVGEDWLLFDPESQEIHVLNLSAALAWSFCDGSATGEEVCAAVVAAFRDREEEDPEPGETPARDEVAGILESFRDRGLLAS